MRSRQLPLAKLFALQKRLFELGGELRTQNHVYANLAGDCEEPKSIDLVARESHSIRQKWRGKSSMFWTPRTYGFLRASMDVRCRKCPTCRKARATNWRLRALNEVREGTRSWFGTLTASFDEHIRREYALQHALAQQGIDFSALPSNEKFGMHVHGYRRNQLDKDKTVLGLGDDVTKWLKRVRKNSGAPFRYLAIVEAHKGGISGNRSVTGFPHFHVLLHEKHEPVRKAVMDDAWPWFASFKLADERSALYVTKYLSKDLTDVRVRASLDYGKNNGVEKTPTRIKF